MSKRDPINDLMKKIGQSHVSTPHAFSDGFKVGSLSQLFGHHSSAKSSMFLDAVRRLGQGTTVSYDTESTWPVSFDDVCLDANHEAFGKPLCECGEPECVAKLVHRS